MAIHRINKYIPMAIKEITNCGISDKDQKVDKNFRSHISSFGASVQIGNLIAAVAFYSKKRGKKSDTAMLMDAINHIIYNNEATLLENVVSDNGAKKEEILDAAVAIKVALNAYILENSNKNNSEIKEAE